MTDSDKADLIQLIGKDVFKKFTALQLMHLKTIAYKAKIDDWISLIDSEASYDDNKEYFKKNYTITVSDSEIYDRYHKYEDMSNDNTYNPGISVNF